MSITNYYSLSLLVIALVIHSSHSVHVSSTTCEERCYAECHMDAVCLNKCIGTRGETEVDFTLASKGLGNPLAIRFGRFPGDKQSAPQRMFVANQDGRLTYSDQNELKNGHFTVMLDLAPLISTTINHFANYAEAGFVGFTLHPKFSTNGRFYVWYSIPRVNKTVANTPNCSFAGGYGPSGPTNGRRNFGVDRAYEPDLYTDLLVLEEYRKMSNDASMAVLVRRLLTLKHFFTNHYGIDNLMFEENDKLLVAVGDGGCYFDQFGTAQNRSFIVGKVISVDVDANSRYIPSANCTTPVALWSELSAVCASTSKMFTLYASGVRNFGHMSLDLYQGKINRYIAMIGQNSAEAIFRFAWESNFGWYRRESRLCACLYDNPLIDPQCDFRQTLAQCLNETSISGGYTYALATFNQANDHVSSLAGGFVYRGTDLPCALQGAYVLGDWSTKDMFTPGFPAPFNGTLQLFQIAVDSNGFNTNQVTQENAHGKIRVGKGLLYAVNYLASWGYDAETDRMYMGVQDIIPPYKANDTVSDRGQIYILTSPVRPLCENSRDNRPDPHRGKFH